MSSSLSSTPSHAPSSSLSQSIASTSSSAPSSSGTGQSRRRRSKQVPNLANAAAPPAPDIGDWRQRGPRRVDGSVGVGIGRVQDSGQGGQGISIRGAAGSRGISSSARRSGAVTLNRQDDGSASDLVRGTEGLSLGGNGDASTPAPTTSAPVERSGDGRRQPRKRNAGISQQVAQQLAEEEAMSSADESGPLLEDISGSADVKVDLESEIQRLYAIKRASPAALEARRTLISELCIIFNHNNHQWGLPRSRNPNPLVIEAFGSVRFGLATSDSDLDLCMFDPSRPRGFDEKFFRSNGGAQKLPDIYDMRKVAIRLRQAGFANITPIPFAAVPIVKFQAVINGEVIQADLNTNERFGVLNSRLLNAYCNLHPHVRPLSVFVKFWAKQRRLNDPSGEHGAVTFSSYTLILLVIAYLQTLSLVPNLQSSDLITAANVRPSMFYTRPRQSRNRKNPKTIPSTGWDTTFVERVPNWTPKDVSLEALARGFFNYFANEFDVESQVVSIANGEPFERQNKFQDFFTKEEAAPVARSQPLGDGEMSSAEETRQAWEDNALAALAEMDDRTPTMVEETPADSRSSSPEEYGEFVEPTNWVHKFVVQDPFILTRNTAMNVMPDNVDRLRSEMGRALALIDEGAPLAHICASIKNEESYQSVAELRKLERKKRQATNNREKSILDRKAGAQARNSNSGLPSASTAVVAPAVEGSVQGNQS